MEPPGHRCAGEGAAQAGGRDVGPGAQDRYGVERAVLMGGGGERRGFDRDIGARKPRAGGREALLANDLRDALGARDVLGDSLPVEQLRLVGRRRGLEVRVEMVVLGRSARVECLAAIGRAPCRARV